MRVAITALVGLHVLGAWCWPGALWGVSQFAVLPRWFAVGWTLAGLVATWVMPLGSWLGARLVLPGRRGAWIVAAGAGLCFWLLREPMHFFGDGYLLIRSRGLSTTMLRAPALVRTVVWMVRGAEDHLGVSMEAALAGLAVAAGVVAVGLGIRLSTGLAEREGPRLAAMVLLATAGANQLFCGHIEYYPCLVPPLLAYLWLAVRGVRGHGPLWPVWLVFPILPTLHLSMLALGPAQAYLAFTTWRRGERARAAAALAAGGCLAIALTRLLGSGEQQLARETVTGLAQYIRPYFDATSLRHTFGFATPGHLLAVLNDLLLVAPMAAVALWAFGRAVEPTEAAVAKFLGSAAAGCLALNLLFNREVGPYRDWDILAPQAYVYLVWCASRLPRLAPPRARAAAALLLVGGVFHLVPWLALHATPGTALRHMRLALTTESNWSPYARGYMHEEIAIFLRGRGDLESALAEYRAAVAANPSDARYHVGVGDVLNRLGRPAAAVPEYEEAIRHRPDYFIAHNNLATTLAEQGRDLDNALQHAETALHLAPANPDVWLTYGSVLDRLQRWDDARHAYEEALRLGLANRDLAIGRLRAMEQRQKTPGSQHVKSIDTPWGRPLSSGVVNSRPVSRRAFLTILAGIPLWVVLRSGRVLAATLRIRHLRQWSAPDHTRIVLELSAAARFETRAYQDPDRIVLEIPGAQADPLEVPVNDGLIDKIRIESMPNTVLVRVELNRPADYAAFPLAPNAGGEAHRIVLDVRKRFTAAERQAQEREAESVRQSGDVVVAIDPGHGGNDPGCAGNRLREKDVALDVARSLAAAIAAKPRMRPLLTRQKDYFVPLGQRQMIAQRYGASLFVSIHCNSAASATARGAEVFFVSLQGAADKAAKALVDRENAADLVGGVPPSEIQTPLVDILMNLKQNEAIKRSERLGEIVVRRLDQLPGGETRGLKQGPLAVLKSISCPSILVELGFVTNRQDAEMLGDPTMRRRYAEQIAGGIDDYLRATG